MQLRGERPDGRGWPASIDRLVLTNLTVGDARVDLALERHANDVGVNVVRREGQLEIVAIK